MRSIITALSVSVVLATAAQGMSIRQGEVSRIDGRWTTSSAVTFDAQPGGKLALGTSKGSVSVVVWPHPQVRVVVTKRTGVAGEARAKRLLGAFQVRARSVGSTLRLDANARTRECAELVDVAFAVYVPRSFNLDIATGEGSIGLPEVDGTFSARTAAGRIRLDCPTDALDIEVEDRTGDERPNPSGEIGGQEAPARPSGGGDRKGRSL